MENDLKIRFELIYDMLELDWETFIITPSHFDEYDETSQRNLARKLFRMGEDEGSDVVKRLCKQYLSEL